MFDKLKHLFTTAPVLVVPDHDRPFQLETDTSKFATSTVLRQQDANGNWHPVACMSHSFNDAERNYDIYDRELLGIVRSLEEWRHYLEGSPHPIEVLSDHQNLTYFRTARKVNRRQARWSLFLSLFDLQLRHVPGTKMVQSDTLSRLQHLNLEVNDNDSTTVLPAHLFISPLDTTLAERIRTTQAKDKVVLDALAAVKDGAVLPMRSTLED